MTTSEFTRPSASPTPPDVKQFRVLADGIAPAVVGLVLSALVALGLFYLGLPRPVATVLMLGGAFAVIVLVLRRRSRNREES